MLCLLSRYTNSQDWCKYYSNTIILLIQPFEKLGLLKTDPDGENETFRIGLF